MLLCASQVRPAWAAGLFLGPPGAAPFGQAGAVVAGGRDPMALIYNPATMGFARSQVMLDGALPLYFTTYTRRIAPYGPSLPPVRGRPLNIVSPNVGAIWAPWGMTGPRLGALLTSDYPLIQAWPGGAQHTASPQRYATGGFGGTVLAKGVVGAAWSPVPYLGLGASAHLLVGRLRSVSTLSACDGVVCTQPENPAYDVTAAMQSAVVAVPGFALGAVFKMGTRWTLGASVNTGFDVQTPATLRLQLPQAPLYRTVTVSPARPQAMLHLRLPSVWRLGAQVRLPRRFEVEAAVSYVPWHVHRQISLSGIDVVLSNIVGVGSYRITDVVMPRHFRDVWALHAAVRRTVDVHTHKLKLRAAVMLEPSAVPPAMLTAMTVDLPKALLALSVAWQYRLVQVTAAYGAVGMLKRNINSSAVQQINPIQGETSGQTTAVGNGLYQGFAQLIGLGATLFF